MARNFSEAGGVKVVKLITVVFVYPPRFISIEQRDENCGFAHFELRLPGDASPVPYVFIQYAEGIAGFGESGTHFLVDDNLRENVLPWFVNLPTAFSRLKLIKMFGSM